MFRIKICGVTKPEDAVAALQAGADMIGLNFYSQSARYVSPEKAARIAAEVPQTTGVFVNATADEIHRTVEQVGLDWIQLHGDETPELVAEIQSQLPLIRVQFLGKHGLQGIAEDVAACTELGRPPRAVLVDATVEGEYGGTGKTADWPALANHREVMEKVPLVLAGGLQAENVAAAIATVQPDAVDTASGVESSPGVKDTQKMQSFIRNAKAAFAQLDSK